MLERNAGRKLPAGWRPPMPFPPIEVHYRRFRGRRRRLAPSMLWVSLRGVDVHTGETVYLAAGPAGRPAAAHLIAALVSSGIPKGTRVDIVTAVNDYGQRVFGVPQHTMN